MHPTIRWATITYSIYAHIWDLRAPVAWAVWPPVKKSPKTPGGRLWATLSALHSPTLYDTAINALAAVAQIIVN
jgi:hypothetical protein